MRISDWSSDVCSSDLRDSDSKSAKHRPARYRDHCFDWRARCSSGSGSRSGTVADGATACGILTEVAAFSSFDDDGDTGWTPSSSSGAPTAGSSRSEEHTSELQSLMRNSYAVFFLKKSNRRRSDNIPI